MKNLILSFLPLLLLVSCTSAQKTDVTSDANAEQMARKYKKSVEAVTINEIKSSNCQKLSSDIKIHWQWEKAVEAANSCVKAKNLLVLEDVAGQIAQREPAAPWGPYFLAVLAREKKEHERALWMVELAIKRAPDVGLLHYFRGQVLWDKKEYGPAVNSIERSTELDSSLLKAHLFLGQLYYRDQEYTLASKHFHAVLKIEPRNAIALAGLAECQLREGNSQSAIDMYSRLSSYYAQNGEYALRLAEIYETVLQKPATALSVYRRLREEINAGTVTNISLSTIENKIKEMELGSGEKRSIASVKGAK